MDKSKQHYDRIQRKKKIEKENKQKALDMKFENVMRVAEGISSSVARLVDDKQ